MVRKTQFAYYYNYFASSSEKNDEWNKIMTSLRIEMETKFYKLKMTLNETALAH